MSGSSVRGGSPGSLRSGSLAEDEEADRRSAGSGAAFDNSSAGGLGAGLVEGRLTIDMQRLKGGGAKVRIASSRPLGASRMLVGKTPQDAVRLAPMIFSLCGMAHAAASAAAFEDALGCEVFRGVQQARDIVVAAETAREHLLRIMLDWPRLLGETGRPAALAGARDMIEAPQRLSAMLFGPASMLGGGEPPRPDWSASMGIVDGMEAFLENAVFGAAPGVWLSDWIGEGRNEDEGVSGEQFGRWAASGVTAAARLTFSVLTGGWSRAGAVEPHFLQRLDRERLLAHLCNEGGSQMFAAAPTWNGLPCETGSFARERNTALVRAVVDVYGPGLLARLAARLTELARLTGFMREKLREMNERGWEPASHSGGPRIGTAQIEAARGLLIHAVELRDRKVARYWIVAPTEWNFHPRGAAFRALASLRAETDDELRAQAELVLHAIDPCVMFDLRVS